VPRVCVAVARGLEPKDCGANAGGGDVITMVNLEERKSCRVQLCPSLLAEINKK
jgi:hypothetical protein